MSLGLIKYCKSFVYVFLFCEDGMSEGSSKKGEKPNACTYPNMPKWKFFKERRIFAEINLNFPRKTWTLYRRNYSFKSLNCPDASLLLVNNGFCLCPSMMLIMIILNCI